MGSNIPIVRLSSSSVNIPLIGFGTAVTPFPGPEAIKEAVLNAIELGYRHFDSAALYQSEKPLGEAIAEALSRGLINSRDELFITSKLWCCDAHYDRVLPGLQLSLRNLGLEYLDLYLIHWPVSSKEVGEYFFPIKAGNLVPMDFKSTWEAMEECQKLGLTKSIGVSNFSCKKLSDLLLEAKIPPAVNQVEMNALWQQQKLRDFCASKGIHVTGYSPLGATGNVWGASHLMECEVLKEIAEARGKTVAQDVDSTGASECSLDFTNVFTTDTIFRSRDALIQWTRDVGKKHGLVIIIKQSDAGVDGRKPRIIFSCERSGTYKSSSKVFERKCPNKVTGTKKCNCPFALKGRKLATDDDWMVTVICGVHNHPNAQHLEGHSYVGRLSDEELTVLIDMSKSLVKPRNILHTLKKRHSNNTTTIKTIYNARYKYKVLEMAGRSQMQQVMMNLEENRYIEWHTNNDETDCVGNLFWAHPSSVELLRAFSEVLIMDSTYKTNKYRLPLFEIVGVTSTQLTFSVAFVYLESEKEQNYTWALERLKSLMDGCMLPHVIVTNRELALMNAIKIIFPKAANLLCRWHISRNILANCKKFFETKDRWEAFITNWNMLVISPTEDDYMQLLSACNRNFCGYPQALDYVKKSWLSKHKEQFVAAWTDKHMHFGNVTTNRVESAHAKLKRHLGSSSCSFDSGWMTIHALLELLFTEIKASFEKSLNTVQHKFRPAIFRELRGFISKNALDIVLNESMRADHIGVDSVACRCVIRRTHGLPCAHEIATNIERFRDIIGDSVATQETVHLDSD